MKEHSFIRKCDIIPLAAHTLMQMSMQMSRGTKLDSIFEAHLSKIDAICPIFNQKCEFSPRFFALFRHKLGHWTESAPF